jgi:hypothetical protein
LTNSRVLTTLTLCALIGVVAAPCLLTGCGASSRIERAPTATGVPEGGPRRNARPTAQVTLASKDGLPGESYPELAPDGAWCWFGDPRVVTVQREHTRTFAGFVTSAGDVVVAQFDHDTGDLSHAVIKADFEEDDHASPSILVRPDGRLVIFYCGHRGRWMAYRMSTSAADIGTWGSARAASAYTSETSGYTYPSPLSLADEGGRRYLFWRGVDFQPMMSVSDKTFEWSDAVPLVAGGGDMPYFKVASDGRSTIHFALTNDHPGGGAVNNVYYFRYEHGTFQRADGTIIGGLDDLPLSLADCDLVYDARAHAADAWVWDVAPDASGNPVIAYVAFPSEVDHRYRYALWEGRGWGDSEIVAAGGPFPSVPVGHRYYEPYYSGGLSLDHADPSVVYLSRPVEGVFEIERWITPDGGATWAHEAVTSGSAANNVRPVVPLGGAAGGPEVIWMNGPYRDYTDYGTSLRMR